MFRQALRWLTGIVGIATCGFVFAPTLEAQRGNSTPEALPSIAEKTEVSGTDKRDSVSSDFSYAGW